LKNGRKERARDWVKESESNSELAKELAPFVVQARARTKAREDGNNESELFDLRSSDFEGVEEDDVTLGTAVVEIGDKGRGKDSIEVIDGEVTATTLQLRPIRAKQALARYQ
jgi:hypothetical protein